MKRTYQPNKSKRKKMHGFLVRSSYRGGCDILCRRRRKGRYRLTR